jgi:NAD(P)-dependent dehydrogenase (short-subunit alcohol dehydrogenase family)
MNTLFDLCGEVAIVTGAGRGIGRAHALLLAERGTRVVVSDVGADLAGEGRDHAVADTVVAEIRAAGGDAVADHSDISTFAGAEQPVARALEAFGKIDIIVNNAGIATGGGSVGGGDIDAITEEQLARVFAVNFTGTVGTIRAAWPHLRAQGWGRIVNTVSEVALDTRMSGGGGIGYAAAKASVWSATLSLAQHGLPHSITVGGGAQFTGGYYFNNTNALTTANAAAIQRLTRYWLFNAMASHRFNPHFDLQMNLNNLANQRYVERGYTGHFVPGPGRSILVSPVITF